MIKKLLKILAALALFTTLIISGTWLTLHRLPDSNTKSKSKIMTPLPPKHAQLFYKTIGDDHMQPSYSANIVDQDTNVGSRYTVEVLVTTNKDRAENAVGALKNRGIDAFYTAFNQQGRVFYKVRTGIFKSKLAANMHLEKVANDEYKGLKVRKL